VSGLRAGSAVKWKFGAVEATGTVLELFEKRVSRTLKGKRITRNGTPDNPAVLLEQADGDRVLKRSSELELE
jgi:hypothetical protein